MPVCLGYSSIDPESEQLVLIYHDECVFAREGSWPVMEPRQIKNLTSPISNELDNLLEEVGQQYGIIPVEEIGLWQFDALEQRSRTEISSSAWLALAFASELAASTGLQLCVCYAWIRGGLVPDIQFLWSLEAELLGEIVLQASINGMIREIPKELVQVNIGRLKELELDSVVSLPSLYGFSDLIFLIDRNFCSQVLPGDLGRLIVERQSTVQNFMIELRRKSLGATPVLAVESMFEITARCGQNIGLVHDLVEDISMGKIASGDEICSWTATRWQEYLQEPSAVRTRIPGLLRSSAHLTAYISFLERSWKQAPPLESEMKAVSMWLECGKIDFLQAANEESFDLYFESSEKVSNDSGTSWVSREKEAS